jgi:hypothetical protein
MKKLFRRIRGYKKEGKHKMKKVFARQQEEEILRDFNFKIRIKPE